MKKIEKRVVRCVATVIAAEMLCLAAKPLSMSAAGGAEQGELVSIEDNAADEYPEFGIDNKGPEIQVMLTAGGREVTGWYSEAVGGVPLQMDILAADDNVVELVEIAIQPNFAKESILYAAVPAWTGNSYIIKTPEGLLEGEQNRTYYIRATDEFGNVSNVTTKEIKIDNTAPDRRITVSFTGTDEMQVQINGGSGEPLSYVMEEGEGIVCDHDKMTLCLKVRDSMSGVASVDFKVVMRDTDGEVVLDRHADENNFVRDGEGNVYVYYETDMPDGREIYEQSFQITDLVITDYAGNTCPTDAAGGDVLQDAVLYVVDKQAPKIVYTYENEGISPACIIKRETGTFYYYAQPFSGKVKIVDMMNLDTDSIRVLSVSNYDIAPIEEVFLPTEDMPGKEAVFSYRLPRDGYYCIAASADDTFHNGFTEEGIAEHLSGIMVVDTAAPQITMSVRDGSGQVYSEYNGRYFSGDITVDLSVYDKNPDLDNFRIIVAGNAADGSSFYDELQKDVWKRNGDNYTAQYIFKQDGQYYITVSCMDLAGNKAEKTSGSFYIDKTAPVVSIIFDNTEALNGFYYNTDRTAVVTVKDYSFLAEGAAFTIFSQYGSPVVPGEWVHHAAGGCDGEGHTSECEFTSVVVFGGDDIYDFSFVCTDRVGLVSDVCDAGHFVVDKTAPVIYLTYDNQSAQNDIYYNTARTAYITVEDLSFSAESIVAGKIGGENMSELPPPNDLKKTDAGGVVSYTFAEDGTYQFSVEAADLAGNRAQVQYSEYFIIDTVPPVLSIEDIVPLSANNGVVRPEIVYRDLYLDEEKTVISVEGFQNGSIYLNYVRNEEKNGYRVSFADFAYVREMDDLYTLSARVEDYAGNVTEQSILFSVNRFGSVYVLDEDTKQFVEAYYSNRERDLLITEINVDALSHAQLTYSRDGEIFTLMQDEAYTVEEEGSDASWRSYTYKIDGANFMEEGHNVVTLYSTDEAGNVSDNRIKEMEIAFAIDKTAPSMVVEGLAANGIYKQESKKITIDVQDNMSLESMTVYIDGAVFRSFDKEALAVRQGIVSFEIGEMLSPSAVSIVATDTVGNISETVYDNVLISTDDKTIEEALAAAKTGRFVSGKAVRRILVTASRNAIPAVGGAAFKVKKGKGK